MKKFKEHKAKCGDTGLQKYIKMKMPFTVQHLKLSISSAVVLHMYCMCDTGMQYLINHHLLYKDLNYCSQPYLMSYSLS